ncbi:MAG TPA: hypothetical protein ENK35_09395, partial [Candidatus Tenderia sp.]|nr:hypothetical protein [Candidatus Tenderia sp.]
LARLTKELEKLEKEHGRLSGKLSNANFVERAPEPVVEKERQKLADVETSLAQYRDQLTRINAL